MRGITAAQLREIADEVDSRYPGATLTKNQVGNLIVFNVDGDAVAWCDLAFGGIHEF